MPSLQLRCSVHPDHTVDTGQGGVNFLTGAEPPGALWALFGQAAAAGGQVFSVNGKYKSLSIYELGVRDSQISFT